MALTATLSVNPSSVQMPDADSVTVLCTVTNTGATTVYIRPVKVWISTPNAASASLGQPSGPWPKTLAAGASLDVNWGAAFFDPGSYTLAAYITDVYEAVSVTPTPVSVTVAAQVIREPGIGPLLGDATNATVTATGSSTTKTLGDWMVSGGGTGPVTSVSGTSPISVATGTTTPVVSIDGNSLQSTSTGSTTARTLAARGADVLNVKDFGAKGDGTTNDYAAIAAAIAALPSRPHPYQGATLYFPPGDYVSNSTITITGNGVNIVAYGAKLISSASIALDLGQASYLTDFGIGYYKIRIDGLWVYPAVDGIGIRSRGIRQLDFHNVYILRTGVSGNQASVSMAVEGCFNLGRFTGCSFHAGSSHGLHIRQRCNNLLFTECAFLGNGGAGVLIDSTTDGGVAGGENMSIRFENCNWEGNAAGGIDVADYAASLTIDGGFFEANTSFGVRFRNDDGYAKQALSVRGAFMHGTGDGILVGNSSTGSALTGVVIQGNLFDGASLTFTGGSKVTVVDYLTNAWINGGSHNTP